MSNLLENLNNEWWTPEMVAAFHGVKLFKVMAHLKNGVKLESLITMPWVEPKRERPSNKVIWDDKVRDVKWTWGFVYYLVYTYDRERFDSSKKSSINHFVAKFIKEYGTSSGLLYWYRNYLVLPSVDIHNHIRNAYAKYCEHGNDFLNKSSAWEGMTVTKEMLMDIAIKRMKAYPKLIHLLPKDKITEMVLLICKRVKEGLPYDE